VCSKIKLQKLLQGCCEIIAKAGTPSTIRSDNEPEFISSDFKAYVGSLASST
jgi:hypothetical protein